jgi:hypothetical protein
VILSDPRMNAEWRLLVAEVDSVDAYDSPIVSGSGIRGGEPTQGHEGCPALVKRATDIIIVARLAIRAAAKAEGMHEPLTHAQVSAARAERADHEAVQRSRTQAAEQPRDHADTPLEPMRVKAERRKVSVEVTKGHLVAKWGDMVSGA